MNCSCSLTKVRLPRENAFAVKAKEIEQHTWGPNTMWSNWCSRAETLTETLISLLPVIIGGGLATLGGVATQYLTHRFSKKRERENLLRDKAERFIRMISSHKDYVSACVDHFMFEKDEVQIDDPLDEVLALARLYFPSAGVSTSEVKFIDAVSKLMEYLHQQRITRLERGHDVEVADNPEFSRLQKEYYQAWKRYYFAILDLVPK